MGCNIRHLLLGTLVTMGISFIPRPFASTVAVLVGVYVSLFKCEIPRSKAIYYGTLVAIIGTLPSNIIYNINLDMSSVASLPGISNNLFKVIAIIASLGISGFLGAFMGYVVPREVITWKSSYWKCPRCETVNPGLISVCPVCGYYIGAVPTAKTAGIHEIEIPETGIQEGIEIPEEPEEKINRVWIWKPEEESKEGDKENEYKESGA